MTRSGGKEPSAVLDVLLPWQSSLENADGTYFIGLLQNDKATGFITEKYIKHLEEEEEEEAGRSRGQLWHEATRGLLRTPAYLLPRRLRERVVSALLPDEKRAGDGPPWTVGEAVIVLDLLVRVTRERTVEVSLRLGLSV